MDNTIQFDSPKTCTLGSEPQSDIRTDIDWKSGKTKLSSLPDLDVPQLFALLNSVSATNLEVGAACMESEVRADPQDPIPCRFHTYLTWARGKRLSDLGPIGRTLLERVFGARSVPDEDAPTQCDDESAIDYGGPSDQPPEADESDECADTGQSSKRGTSFLPDSLWRDTGSLTPHPLNSKIYSDRQDPQFELDVLAANEDGTLEPIVITPDGTILSGHRRWHVLMKFKIKRVRVHVVNVENEVLALVSYNRHRHKTPGEQYEEGKAWEHEFELHPELLNAAKGHVLPLDRGEARDPHLLETTAIVAAKIGMHREKYRKLCRVLESPLATADLKASVRSGDTKLTPAYDIVKKLEPPDVGEHLPDVKSGSSPTQKSQKDSGTAKPSSKSPQPGRLAKHGNKTEKSGGDTTEASFRPSADEGVGHHEPGPQESDDSNPTANEFVASAKQLMGPDLEEFLNKMDKAIVGEAAELADAFAEATTQLRDRIVEVLKGGDESSTLEEGPDDIDEALEGF